MNQRQVIIVAVVCVFAVCLPCRFYGDASLPNIFGDHMVIQQQKPVIIWGWADAGEEVDVRLGSQSASAKADSGGNWSVSLKALKASSSPIQMIVKAANTVTVNDILVGEVWLCSGQSNMEWGLGDAETGSQEIPQADFPKVRLFKINSRPGPYPVSNVNDNWRLSRPDTVSDFTAVGYFFGKHLHKELNVPVGLVQAAWGGTRIEPWTPRVGFEGQEALADIVRQIDGAEVSYRSQLPGKMKEMEAWIEDAKRSLRDNKRIPATPVWPGHPIYSEGHPTEPTCLYNSFIYPIVPFAMRGAIWYQGESNMGEAMLYYEKMKALISGWRNVWNDESMSFYFVQLAPFRRYGVDDLPRIWQAQTESLKIPNTGMAVISDVGNIEDIHPRNKRDVGKRLALWALGKDYGGKDIVFSGPIYKSMKTVGDKIEISFDYVGDGLVTRNGKEPDWFEIAGEDKQFYPAKAQIEGDKILVSSDKVASPAAVRFGWDNIAEPNLMNKNGLPASSFRTDNW